uniref:Immunoglobulin domain-containing protein n=1 Tax=Terrapene triunguis TaxID=2587831 RepID=A0A674JVN4_9SAUR
RAAGSDPPLRTVVRIACLLPTAEPSYPKPNISLLSPSGGVSLGGAMTIRCQGQRLGVRFVLNKERRHFPPVDSVGFGAVFLISNVRREHSGSYSCSYHSRSEPFAVSYPSDPVELVVRGEGPSLASLFPAPPPARPSRGLGGQRRDVRFFLHKAGDLNPQRNMDPAGDGAEFRIPTVGRQHGGSYSCSYRPQSEPFVSSQPSDPVELVVAGEGPGSALSPGPIRGDTCQGVALGGAATIRCQAQLQNATFLLYKDGGYWGQAAPVEDVAEFPVTGAGWRDPGSYRCSYHTTREPVAMSHPSDPAQLVVRGEGPRSVSPSHSAPGPRQQGGRGEDPLGQLNGLVLPKEPPPGGAMKGWARAPAASAAPPARTSPAPPALPTASPCLQPAPAAPPALPPAPHPLPCPHQPLSPASPAPPALPAASPTPLALPPARPYLQSAPALPPASYVRN